MAYLLETINQKISFSTKFLKSSTPQILFGLSILSCVYLLNKQQKQDQQVEPLKKEKKQKKRSSSQKNLDENKNEQQTDIIQDLKKSQKKFNKKLNKHFDDSIDITEEMIPRSPDYSVVSEVDQNFFKELFQNKNKTKKAYQTDCESGPLIPFRGFKRRQNVLEEEGEKKNEDRIFYYIQSRVIEQEEGENDNDIEDDDDY